MNTIIIYRNNNKISKKFNNHIELIDELYINGGYITDSKIINAISSIDEYFPVYDIYYENIIMTSNNNIYDKLYYKDYRPINKSILKLIKETTEKKIITFISNFNVELLEKTFIKNNTDYIDNFTTCVRSDFIFIFKRSDPYYQPIELKYLKKIYDKQNISNDDVDSLCKLMENNTITRDDILKHHIYIRENDAKLCIYNYVVIQGYIMNKYLRFDSKKNKNSALQNNIDAIHSLVRNSPALTKSIYLYRYVQDDYYLRRLINGDIYNDYGFSSCRSDAFSFFLKNQIIYGYNLLVIKVPANMVGICLVLYNDVSIGEKEVLLAPGKFKIINTNFTNYVNPDEYTNSKLEKIYELEYLGPINNIYDVLNEKKEIVIDDLNLKYIEGDTTEDKINTVINRHSNNYLVTNIGNERVVFYVRKMFDLKKEQLFFYLRNPNLNKEDYKPDHEAIVLISYDNNGNMNLIIEIGNIISLNFLKRFMGGDIKIKKNRFDDLIIFLKKIAKAFKIDKIRIHSVYKRYYDIIDMKKIDFSHRKQFIKMYASDNHFYNELFYYIVSKYDDKNEKFNKKIKKYLSPFTQFLYDKYGSEYQKKINEVMSFSFKEMNKKIAYENSLESNFEEVRELAPISDEFYSKNNDAIIFDFFMYLHENNYYLIWLIASLIKKYYEIDLLMIKVDIYVNN